MKKIIRILFFINLLLLITFTICACDTTNTQNNSQQNNSQQNNSQQNNSQQNNSQQNNSQENNQTENQPQKSAYEQLNDIEKEIFDIFVKASTSLNNPSSARMYEIYSFKTLYTTSEQFMQEKDLALYIKISAQNTLGSTITRTIKLHLRSTAQEYSVIADYTEYFDNPNKPPFASYDDLVSFNLASPSKINKALKEHWEDFGI